MYGISLGFHGLTRAKLSKVVGETCLIRTDLHRLRRHEALLDPERWNLNVLFFVASVLGGVAYVSSLIMLYAALDSWNPEMASVW